MIIVIDNNNNNRVIWHGRIYTAHTAVIAVTLVGTQDILLANELSIISKSLESVKLEKASIVCFFFVQAHLFIHYAPLEKV